MANLYAIGRTHFLQNRYEAAGLSLVEALDSAQTHADTYWTAIIQILLGRLSTRLGDRATGRRHLSEASAAIEEFDYGDQRGEVLMALGQLELQAGNTAEARGYLERAAALWEGEMPDAASVEATVYLGLLDAEDGDVQRLLDRARASLREAESRQRAHLASLARLLVARLQIRQMAFEPALETLREVPDSGDVSVGPELVARRYHLESLAAAALGFSDEAEQHAQQASALMHTVQNSLAEASRAAFAARPDVRPILN